MSCVCGGSNENCMYCFGTGSGRETRRGRAGARTRWLSDEQVREFLAKYPLLQPNPLQPPEGSEAKRRPHQPTEQRHESRPEESCERSFVSSSPLNVRSVHLPAIKRGSPVLDVMKVARELATPTCPSCHIQFAHHIDLRAHMQEGCPKPKPIRLRRIKYNSPEKSRQTCIKALSKTRSKMTKCSFCGCPVKNTNLQRHLGRCPKHPAKYSNGHRAKANKSWTAGPSAQIQPAISASRNTWRACSAPSAST